jgi:hypothetical protein
MMTRIRSPRDAPMSIRAEIGVQESLRAWKALASFNQQSSLSRFGKRETPWLVAVPLCKIHIP